LETADSVRDNIVPLHQVLVKAEVVAAHLGYKSKDTILAMARRKQIPALRIKSGCRTHWRFDLEEVLRAMVSNR